MNLPCSNWAFCIEYCIVENASRTLQISDFPNSPSAPQLESCISFYKTCKGLSASIRVHWNGLGEVQEVQFVGQTWAAPISHCDTFAQQHLFLPARCTLRCMHWPLKGQLSGSFLVTAAAFMLRVLAITFRIHKDKNEINMSRKMALLTTLNNCSRLCVMYMRSDGIVVHKCSWMRVCHTPYAGLISNVTFVTLFAQSSHHETTLLAAHRSRPYPAPRQKKIETESKVLSVKKDQNRPT